MFLLNSVTKIFVITVREFEPATSCVRDQDATTAPARQCERQDLYIQPNLCISDLSDSLNLLNLRNLLNLMKSSVPFRKNSNQL